MLAGKSVIITGSGRGIGAACAIGIARQGAAVVVNDLDDDAVAETVEAITSSGGRAVGCVADVSDWEECGRIIKTCVDAFGRVDGLVNNAALYHVGGVETLDPGIARAMVEVNVLGPMFCIGHAVKIMLAQGSGSIVNVVSGAHMGMPSMGIYGATKGAVASMVYTWSMELAGTGVRMNALSPFGVSNLTENSHRVFSRRLGGTAPKSCPPPRNAELQPPEANSPIIEYLLSDAASDVTGQLVRIDNDEVQLYTHPALLLPSIKRNHWDASAVAEVFEQDLKKRLVACGVLGMEQLPVELESGHWKRSAMAR